MMCITLVYGEYHYYLLALKRTALCITLDGKLAQAFDTVIVL